MIDRGAMLSAFLWSQGTERVVILKEGDPMGRHVVIIDDLAQSGTTLLACRKLMYSAGAADVSAFVTHAVLPQDAWRRLAQQNLDPVDLDLEPASRAPAQAGLDPEPVSSVAMPTSVGANVGQGSLPGSRGHDDSFRHVWLTDSCPRTASAVAGVSPFEVLSLSGLIAEALTS